MKLIKPFIAISSFTFLSKILGFIRDVLIAAIAGAGIIADVFFVAFKLPNFFRRLFAEGAFSAAFIPIFSSILKTKGKAKAMEFGSEVLSLLFFILFVVVIIFELLMPLVVYFLAPGFAQDPEKLNLLIELSRITFPYLFFISLVSLFTGILNSFNKFAAGSAAPILLNLTFIIFILCFEEFFKTKGHMLSWAVFFAGLFQLIFLIFVIYKNDLKIFFIKPKYSSYIKKLFKLIIPGAIGAGVIQINLLIDVILASFLKTGSISYLYYAERINQLPIALIGVALGTALLPTLSKQISKNKKNEALFTQNRAIEFSLFLAIPSTIAIFILAEPIISAFFERGEFNLNDRILSAKALQAFAIGIPAYVLVKILTPIFFARQNTVTPVKIAIFCVFINFFLNIILMYFYQHVGIAIATAIASWVNCLLLLYLLLRNREIVFDKVIKEKFKKLILINIFFGLLIFYSMKYINIFSIYKFLNLSIFVFLSFFIYILLLNFFKIFIFPKFRLFKLK
ncbi:MAG: Lipid II flippase MurJ [Alphaproteobacteria bacterium MarineAlpha6_Bin4]|nr:MAG: Lipid II flippase MurJ [Alphaproteobacteria bacterium MarineAlpha6_Bin5]PPR38370.1 MAG: Lipid II flippase MurJ [Alphaproteobacteria bacterium MarineAlpha6_Bin4]|tara:strand:+ start:3819 stop:5348 length:1530 start_codon:yes stop_codon:yes gene_type:complete